MAVFRKSSQSKTKTVMRIQRSLKHDRSNIPLYEDMNVAEPAKKSVTATDSYFAKISENTLPHYRICDLVWFLLKTLCTNMGIEVSADA